uniref:Uncharacterized protein n=1 Tax=Anguilla anguilla TaxID=7936 RepID=A0A0E9XCG6_ANGAN
MMLLRLGIVINY